jgi:hypothetical protein
MFKKLALAGALCCALAAPALAQLAPPFANAQTATLSAVALPVAYTSNGVVLKADYANTGTIYIGPAGVTTATGYPLKAGEAISYGIGNLSAIYMIGTNTTDTLHFTGN